MPYIDSFRNRLKPGYDMPRLRADLIQWLMECCGGRDNSFNVWDVVVYYFDEKARQRKDYEALFFIQDLLNKVSYTLAHPKEDESGYFLTAEREGRLHIRYLALTSEEAEKHILKYSSRAINAVTTAQDKADIGIDSYQLSPSNPIIQVANKMAEALPEGKHLREGAKKYIKDKEERSEGE